MVTKAQAKTVLDLISKFIPKSNYKKAKHTNGGKFNIAATGQPYVGFYIEDSKGNFIAGETPEEKGPELFETVQVSSDTLNKPTGLLLEVLKRELTQNEIEQGSIKRYFTQDLHNNTIAEVLPETYFTDKQDTLRKNTLEVEWITKGPADDRLFGKYPYQGAESKNRQTIQEANKTMPGISTYISDYRYLVQEAAINTNISTSTGTGIGTSIGAGIGTGTGGVATTAYTTSTLTTTSVGNAAAGTGNITTTANTNPVSLTTGPSSITTATGGPATTVFTTSALATVTPNRRVAGIVETTNTTAITTTNGTTTINTSITYEEDRETQTTSLENLRKANFDTRT